MIKKVTVKFDSCSECPVNRYSGCEVYNGSNIPEDCPIETSAMLNRYTEFSRSRGQEYMDDMTACNAGDSQKQRQPRSGEE